MPVLATSDELKPEITPRSALRHRPILDNGKRPAMSATTMPIVQRASRPRPTQPDTSDDIVEWSRDDSHAEPAHTKARPATSPASKRTAKPLPSLPHTGTAKIALQAHPLLYLGLGMFAMLILWVALSALFGWVNTFMDDIHYGRPRTFQMDAWVGHNEQTGTPSHFIAINLNRHIEIIEIPGGDATHTRIYVGPQLYGANDELVPVTLAFADLNGDHKPDMIVTFQQSRIVYINDQGGFRPLLPSERPQVEQALQRLQH